MSEDELLYAVTSGSRKRPGLCRVIGVRYFHAYDSRRSVPGWPDLVLLGTRGLMFRELKTQSGTLRPEQREWGNALRAVGANWDTWRPGDLISGRIAAELRELMGG